MLDKMLLRSELERVAHKEFNFKGNDTAIVNATIDAIEGTLSEMIRVSKNTTDVEFIKHFTLNTLFIKTGFILNIKINSSSLEDEFMIDDERRRWVENLREDLEKDLEEEFKNMKKMIGGIK